MKWNTKNKLLLQKCKRLHSQIIKISERRIKREQQIKRKYLIKNFQSLLSRSQYLPRLKFYGSYAEYESNEKSYFQKF